MHVQCECNGHNGRNAEQHDGERNVHGRWNRRNGVSETTVHGAPSNLLPLPQSELDINPNLTQNPGW